MYTVRSDTFVFNYTDAIRFSQYGGDVIRINGDEEFEEWADRMNWSGDGSPENPYIIENITMKVPFKTNGIFISNTTVHFIIRNCNISFAHNDNENTFFSGIKLYNVANAVIENNTFYKDEMGISIYESSDVEVAHNRFYWDVVGRAGSVPSPPLNIKVFKEGDHFNITWTASKDNGGWEILEYRVYCNGELIGKIYPYHHKIFYYSYTPKNPGVYVFYVIAVNVIGEGDRSKIVAISYKLPYKNWSNNTSNEDYIWIDLEVLGTVLIILFLGVIIYRRMESLGKR